MPKATLLETNDKQRKHIRIRNLYLTWMKWSIPTHADAVKCIFTLSRSKRFGSSSKNCLMCWQSTCSCSLKGVNVLSHSFIFFKEFICYLTFYFIYFHNFYFIAHKAYLKYTRKVHQSVHFNLSTDRCTTFYMYELE